MAGVSQRNLLFGIRGGASIGRIGRVCGGLVRSSTFQETFLYRSKSDTSFAEALGIGVDLRLIRLLGWRTQIDDLKQDLPAFERRNLRLSSGVGGCDSSWSNAAVA